METQFKTHKCYNVKHFLATWLSLLLSFSAVVWIRATQTGATTFQNPASAARSPLGHVWVSKPDARWQLRALTFFKKTFLTPHMVRSPIVFHVGLKVERQPRVTLICLIDFTAWLFCSDLAFTWEMRPLHAFARVYQPFDCLRFQVAAPRNSSLFEYIVDEQPIMIYAEVICKRALLPVEILLFFF